VLKELTSVLSSLSASELNLPLLSEDILPSAISVQTYESGKKTASPNRGKTLDVHNFVSVFTSPIPMTNLYGTTPNNLFEECVVKKTLIKGCQFGR